MVRGGDSFYCFHNHIKFLVYNEERLISLIFIGRSFGMPLLRGVIFVW
nr:MAG TPA: hypothetical protein [Caudoviricetes sp.]